MNAMVKPMGGALATETSAVALRAALKNSLYPGASDASVDMVLSYCQAAQLDPMTKPVHLVPMRVKKAGSSNDYEWRDVVMPGIELYRTKAHRTGEYAGQDEPEFGPTIDGRGSSVSITYPEWCKVTVYRLIAGQRVPFSARVFWLETYATERRDSEAPNAMWRKRPFGQLEKCAEALALRKAFPEAVGAQPTAEEMEGRTLVGEVLSVKPVVEMPQAKSATTPAAAPPPAEPAVVTTVEPAELAADLPGGIHGLSDSQDRILKARAKSAGLSLDAVLERWPRIDTSNLNEVLGELRRVVEATTAGTE